MRCANVSTLKEQWLTHFVNPTVLARTIASTPSTAAFARVVLSVNQVRHACVEGLSATAIQTDVRIAADRGFASI